MHLIVPLHLNQHGLHVPTHVQILLLESWLADERAGTLDASLPACMLACTT